jgi:hypothetical protein
MFAFLATILDRNAMDHIFIGGNGDFIKMHVIAIIKGISASSTVGRSLRKFGPFLLFIGAVVVLLFFSLGRFGGWFVCLAGRSSWGLKSDSIVLANRSQTGMTNMKKIHNIDWLGSPCSATMTISTCVAYFTFMYLLMNQRLLPFRTRPRDSRCTRKRSLPVFVRTTFHSTNTH